MKCEICGKETEELFELEVAIIDERIQYEVCNKCLVKVVDEYGNAKC